MEPSLALRQQGLGRKVARALSKWLVCSLLALFMLPADAAPRRVVALLIGDSNVDSESLETIQSRLASMGYRQVAWQSFEQVRGSLEIISVIQAPDQSACRESIPVTDFRARIKQAEESLLLLDLKKSLAQLSLLEVDTDCLNDVPKRDDLFELAVITAFTHFLNAQATQDTTAASFHSDESRRALERAAAVGPDLAPPTWLEPSLLDKLVGLQSNFDLDERVPVVVGGPQRYVHVNGRVLHRGGHRLSPGTHLAHVMGNDEKISARERFTVLPKRRYLLWAAPGQPALTVEDLEASLDDLLLYPDNPKGESLAALLSVLEQDVDGAVIVAMVDGKPRVWNRQAALATGNNEPPQAVASVQFDDRGKVIDLPSGKHARVLPIDPFIVRVQPVVGWTQLNDDVLEGLGGLNGGVNISTQVALDASYAAVLHFGSLGRVSALPTGYDDDWLVRLLIPMRGGVHYHSPRGQVSFDLGVEGGALYLGDFAGEPKWKRFVAVAGGASLPITQGVAARADAWMGMGQVNIAGLCVGLELW